MSKILVTGGTGFVGSHTILQLLAAGHEVTTSVRSRNRETALRDLLERSGAASTQRLACLEAQLDADAGWPQAVAGCDYVLHVASPFPTVMPRDADELIRPAREGTLRVLRAARDAGVKRVVLTSSFAAIGYGHAPRSHPFDETDWTDDTQPLSAYVKSKTLAERAAWNFMASQGGGMQLTVVNPVVIFGPVLGPDLSSSIVLVQRMMNGALPGLPRVWFGVVDVRDVADLHVRAMSHAAAAGERFLAVAGDFISLLDIARALKIRLAARAEGVPTRQLPDWLVKLAALGSSAAKLALPELGKRKNATHEKASRLLGWTPRCAEDALVATAESLARAGLLEPRRSKWSGNGKFIHPRNER